MERLAGMKDYFEYEEDVRVKVHVKNAENIGKLLLGNPVMKNNRDLNDHCFNLGWSSIVLLEQIGGQFSIKDLYCCNQNETIKNTMFDGHRYCQAATHVVDSCTFVHIGIGETLHLLAHLDQRDLEVGFKKIERMLSENPDDNRYAFCSHVYGKAELDFAEQLKNLCRLQYTEYLRYRSKNLPEERNEDAEAKFFAENRFGHMEIGLYINGDKRVELFGDVTDCSSCIGKKEAPAMLFETVRELQDVNPEDIK